ncbi:MAG: hypothetical protein KAU21_06000 [Gammaproteobacteria bacterium]|nr:hypothetical protein [Gammaproteobacteria bacterium]
MVTRHSEQQVQIEANIRSNISTSDFNRLVEIAAVYLPITEVVSKALKQHIQHADSLRLARDNKNIVVGFSIASSTRQLTPFYSKPINIIYQRMLFLDSSTLYKGLGMRLLIASFTDLLGPLWPFRHFTVVCRTQNPVVARMMDKHTVCYPHYGEKLPDKIRAFAETLLPMLGATELDSQCRLLGTVDEFKDMDFTEIWNKHLHKQRNNNYEKLMLNSAFTLKEGKIINSGAMVFMLAYSKPMQFLRFLFH